MIKNNGCCDLEYAKELKERIEIIVAEIRGAIAELKR